MQNKVEHLIVIAGGNATRLEKHHQNLIPKILLNVDDETVLAKILNFWESKVDNIHIVVKSVEESAQIREYVNLVCNNFSSRINLYVIDSKYHTAFKLRQVAAIIEGNGNAYITWSDIWPTELSEHDYDANYIITDENRCHRMSFDNNQVEYTPDANGNICGIFYVKQLVTLLNIYSDGATLSNGSLPIFNNIESVDFTEVIRYLIQRKIVNFKSADIKIIDVGDDSKYENYVKLSKIDSKKTRYFNSLQINDKTVTKTSNCRKGRNLMKNEIMFYQTLEKTNFVKRLFPKLEQINDDATTTSLTIERILGKTVFENIQQFDATYQNIEFGKKVLETFDSTISELHNSQTINFKELAMYGLKMAKLYEYVDVTKHRLNSIDAFLNMIESANHEELLSKSSIIDIITAVVHKSMCNETKIACLIHGDPNTSNVMIEDETSHMKFIDPRGTFGQLLMIGDSDYDYAKFLYGLSGYDSFNTATSIKFSTKFNQETGKYNINYELPPHYNLDDLTDNVYHKLLVSIIWMKLSAYIINNPIKAIIAYAHGAKMFKKYSNQFNSI